MAIGVGRQANGRGWKPLKSKWERTRTVQDIVWSIWKHIEVHKRTAWSCEPSELSGILFWDRISNYNLLSEDKEFEYAGTNPCARG